MSFKKMISNKFPDVVFVASNEMVEELFKKKYPKLVKESEPKTDGFFSRFNQKLNESSSMAVGIIGASIHKVKNKESTKDVLTHAEEISAEWIKHTNNMTVKNTKPAPVYSIEDKASIILKGMKIPTEVTYISLEDAKKLKIPKEDKVTENSFFIKHPHIQGLYIRPENFQIELAKAKENVYIQLAIAFGAKEIRLVTNSLNHSNKKVNSNIPLPQYGLLSGFGVSFNSTTNQYRSTVIAFDPTDHDPYIPSDLQEWVDQDMELQTMWDGRKDGKRQKTHTMKLHYFNETNGSVQVAASLLNILKQEFNAKITQQKFEATTVLLEIDYH